MPRLAKPDIKVEETPKITCICCGKANQKDFYESANPFQKYYGKIPYCKDCIKGVMWDYYCKKYHKQPNQNKSNYYSHYKYNFPIKFNYIRMIN